MKAKPAGGETKVKEVLGRKTMPETKRKTMEKKEEGKRKRLTSAREGERRLEKLLQSKSGGRKEGRCKYHRRTEKGRRLS